MAAELINLMAHQTVHKRETVGCMLALREFRRPIYGTVTLCTPVCLTSQPVCGDEYRLLYQKGSCYMGIKLFNHLPLDLKKNYTKMLNGLN
jgi:hypothetical protein